MPRFALISAALPPARSGQSIILHRLLDGMDPAQYCLIANAFHQANRMGGDATQPLPGPLHYIHPATAKPLAPYSRSKLADFPIVAARELFSRARQIQRIVKEEGCQSILICTGDFYDFPAAYLAAKWAGIKLYAYMFDDYCYQSTRPVRAIAWLWERMVLRAAAGIIVTNEFARREYLRRHGVDSTVIQNGFESPDLHELDKAPTVFSNAGTNIVFSGTIYNAHYDSFRRLLRALESLGRNDIKLHLFTAQGSQQLATEGIQGPMIVHHGFKPQQEVFIAERQADLLFLPLAFESSIQPLLKTSAPGKTAEYLALGRPILVHAPQDTFVSWYFKQKNCGIVIDQPDVPVLANSIRELIGHPEIRARLSQRAREAFLEDFQVDMAKDRFIRFLERAT